MTMTQRLEQSLSGLLFASALIDAAANTDMVSNRDFDTIYLGSKNFSPMELIEFGEKYNVLKYHEADMYHVNQEEYNKMRDVLFEIFNRFNAISIR